MIERLSAEEAARDQSDAARRDLVAAVSHDLRTPITSLRLLADAVQDEIVDSDTRRAYLKRMNTHIDALSALIDDLFELSRLEAGDIGWSLEQVPLGELVGETVEAMRAQAEAKGVAVHAEVPSALAPARANPEKLQRVLFNLIQNAIRHTPADGSVVVRAEPVAGRIEVEVADDGEGIALGGARARIRCVLPRRRGSVALRRRRRPRAGRLTRDRRGARRADLAGGRARGYAGAVQPAIGQLTPSRDVSCPAGYTGCQLPCGSGCRPPTTRSKRQPRSCSRLPARPTTTAPVRCSIAARNEARRSRIARPRAESSLPQSDWSSSSRTVTRSGRRRSISSSKPSSAAC